MRRVNFFFGLLLAVLLLYLFFRKVELRELGIALRQANYWLLVPAGFAMIAAHSLRAARWYYLLRGIKEVKYFSLFSALMLGFAINFLVPARAGELVRAYLLGSKEDIPKSSTLASIVMERLFDGLVVILFMLAILVFCPFRDSTTLPGLGRTFGQVKFRLALVIGSVYVPVLLLVLMLYLRQDTAVRFIRLVLTPFPERIGDKVVAFTYSFADGFRVLRNLKDALACLVLSLGIWLMAGFVMMPVIAAFPFRVRLPLYTPWVVTTAIAISSMVPTPGYVGSYHLFVRAGMKLCNEAVNINMTSALAIVAHAAALSLICSVALVCALVERISLREIKMRAETADLSR